MMQAREYDNGLRFRRGSGDRKQDYRTAHENQRDTLANACLLPHLPLPIGADAPQKGNLGGTHRGLINHHIRHAGLRRKAPMVAAQRTKT
jgi:hypothetical protein